MSMTGEMPEPNDITQQNQQQYFGGASPEEIVEQVGRIAREQSEAFEVNLHWLIPDADARWTVRERVLLGRTALMDFIIEGVGYEAPVEGEPESPAAEPEVSEVEPDGTEDFLTEIDTEEDVTDRGPLLSPAEAARIFKVSPKTITRWANDGKIPHIKTLGGHRRIYYSAIVRILEANTEPRLED